MKLKDIQQLLKADVLCGSEYMEKHAYHACASDLLSDVLVHVDNQSVLLTGLCNPQVFRTAEMLDIICIVFVRGKKPNEDLIEMAKERELCVFATASTMFTASGVLYSSGLRGGRDVE
jgi:DRTGG domain